MAWFIVFIVIFVIGALYLGITRAVGLDRSVDRALITGNTIAAVCIIILSLFALLFASLCQIGTQTIAVKTAFGHPTGGLTNGIHWKKPWEKINRLDGKVQTDTYASNADDSNQRGAQGGCVSVRIARQATACVNVTIRWQLNKQGIDYLFRNYHTTANIRDNLLHRDLQTAVNVAFGHYDPLGLDTNGQSTQPTTAALGATVLKELQEQVGQYLNVSTVFIPIFNFDGDTQKRLNQLQTQVAQTRVAEQAKQTAIAQAEANRRLRASVSNDPNVLVSKCLDVLSEAVQKNQPLPAGFSCFPGGGNADIAVSSGK